jgi:hypothetical protein
MGGGEERSPSLYPTLVPIFMFTFFHVHIFTIPDFEERSDAGQESN